MKEESKLLRQREEDAIALRRRRLIGQLPAGTKELLALPQYAGRERAALLPDDLRAIHATQDRRGEWKRELPS